jgi:hypothetical protein
MRVTMGTFWCEEKMIFESVVGSRNLRKGHPEDRGRFQMQTEPDGPAAQAGDRGTSAEVQG